LVPGTDPIATRLAAAKQAVQELLNEYGKHGDVRVQIGTFAESSQVLSSSWMTLTEAEALLDTLTDGTGGTNYDYGLDGMQEAFDKPGKLEGGQNVSYFLSDGEPTLSSDYPNSSNNNGGQTNLDKGDGIDAQEESEWEAFLAANQIQSHAIGLGSDVSATHLNPIAYDGITETELNAVIVDDFNDLANELKDTIVPPTGKEFKGTDANDTIIGSELDDVLLGQAGSDILIGGEGDDIMFGGEGADHFVVRNGDVNAAAPETDVIRDFSQAEGDKLDLSDLLPDGADAASLDAYLHFEKQGNDTVIHVNTDGDYSNNSLEAGKDDHLIRLENVDLTVKGSDQDILQDLLSNNNLLTD